MTAGLGHPGNARGRIAVEHRLVFGDSQVMCSVDIQRGEIKVACASVGIVELTARERESDADFDERQHSAL